MSCILLHDMVVPHNPLLTTFLKIVGFLLWESLVPFLILVLCVDCVTSGVVVVTPSCSLLCTSN